MERELERQRDKASQRRNRVSLQNNYIQETGHTENKKCITKAGVWHPQVQEGKAEKLQREVLGTKYRESHQV